MTTYRVIDNDDDRFPGHVLIEQTEDNGTVVRSWAPDEHPIEARLNPHYPVAEDHRKGAPKGQQIRWALPSAEVHAMHDTHPDAEQRRQALKAEAQKLGLDVSHEVLPRHDVKPGQPTPRRATT